jgi:hypothetical protein
VPLKPLFWLPCSISTKGRSRPVETATSSTLQCSLECYCEPFWRSYN